MSNKWYMYVVQCSDSTYYTGVTTEISRRVHEHNTTRRGAKYTRSRRPVRLIHWEEHPSRSFAQIAESKFKKLTRKKKDSAISASLSEKLGTAGA